MRATAPSGSPAGSTIAGAIRECGGMGQGVGAKIWPMEPVDWREAGIWLAVFQGKPQGLKDCDSGFMPLKLVFAELHLVSHLIRAITTKFWIVQMISLFVLFYLAS